MTLRCTTPEAKRMKDYFTALARHVGLSTKGVSVSISRRCVAPNCVGSHIQLPNFADEPWLYSRSFVHELKHARDTLDGHTFNLTRDQIEARARATEALLPKEDRDRLLIEHGFEA